MGKMRLRPDLWLLFFLKTNGLPWGIRLGRRRWVRWGVRCSGDFSVRRGWRWGGGRRAPAAHGRGPWTLPSPWWVCWTTHQPRSTVPVLVRVGGFSVIKPSTIIHLITTPKKYKYKNPTHTQERRGGRERHETRTRQILGSETETPFPHHHRTITNINTLNRNQRIDIDTNHKVIRESTPAENRDWIYHQRLKNSILCLRMWRKEGLTFAVSMN